MRLCEQVDEWYVLRTTQIGEIAFLFLVPRLTRVERPSSLLWSVVFRAVARVAVCVATSLCDSSDDFRSTAQDSRKTLLLSCHHNSFLDTWWRSRCFDPYCRTEELWLIWPYGGGIWKHVDGWETLESTMEIRLNSSLSSSRILE